MNCSFWALLMVGLSSKKHFVRSPPWPSTRLRGVVTAASLIKEFGNPEKVVVRLVHDVLARSQVAGRLIESDIVLHHLLAIGGAGEQARDHT